MTKSLRSLAEKLKKPEPESEETEGLAEAAEKNRECQARFLIVEAFRRLGIPVHQWPDFVRAFSTDLEQQVEYHQRMTPSPFQPPEFDCLNESPRDWVKRADSAWNLHRNEFLQKCDYWVSVGVDEKIAQPKHARATGTKSAVGRRRGNKLRLLCDMNGLPVISPKTH